MEEKEEETPSERVKRELLGWPGVTMHDHHFGGIEFRVNGRGRWVSYAWRRACSVVIDTR
jgi:hypothetical protein